MEEYVFRLVVNPAAVMSNTIEMPLPSPEDFFSGFTEENTG